MIVKINLTQISNEMDHEISMLTKYLKRNNKGYKKCGNACVMMLMIFRFRNELKILGKDIMKLIIDLVWDSRGTSIWIDNN